MIKGVDSTIRTTNVVMDANSKLFVLERLMTDGDQKAESDIEVCMNGSGSSAQIISRSVGKGNSSQVFHPKAVGKNKCHDDEPTSFERDMNSISWLLIRLMLVMVPVVFFINGLTDGDWLEAGVFALSVGVGLTPEMLPMIITASLAKGFKPFISIRSMVNNKVNNNIYTTLMSL